MRQFISKRNIKSIKRPFKTNRLDMRRGLDSLLLAQRCWDSLRTFREERDRNIRYCYGDQWGDTIKVDGKVMREDEYLRSQGNVPLKNNLIRRLVRSVVGQFRSASKEPICAAYDADEQNLGDVMTVALQANWRNNMKSELDARGMEEFLVSGAVFQKETYCNRNSRFDCYTDLISPNRIFFDTNMSDVRHWDLSVIGEIHDLSFEQLCAQFANTPADVEALRECYGRVRDRMYLANISNREEKNKLHNIDFLCTYDNTTCRVIEVWTQETRQRLLCQDPLATDDIIYKDEVSNIHNIELENEQRIRDGLLQGIEEEDIPLIEYDTFYDTFWKFQFLTPDGYILQEGDTPYKHGSHPYVIKLYPYTNGEVHSMVGDVIDQQRYVNRLITLNDKVIRSSSKGVLLYPKSMIPEDKTPEDIANEWARPDGIIFYDDSARTANQPTQISSKSVNIGISEMLQLQMSLLEEISGVHGALQGKAGFAGQSASLYAQQTQNATVGLLDLMESYDAFILDGAKKKVKNIQQYYDAPRMLNVVGKRVMVKYEPVKMADIDMDVNIIEGISTPAARYIANDYLMQLWSAGAINVKQLLEHGQFAFKDALLESIKADEQRMQQGQQPQGMPAELREQIAQQADHNSVNQMQQIMRGGDPWQGLSEQQGAIHG